VRTGRNVTYHFFLGGRANLFPRGAGKRKVITLVAEGVLKGTFTRGEAKEKQELTPKKEKNLTINSNSS